MRSDAGGLRDHGRVDVADDEAALARQVLGPLEEDGAVGAFPLGVRRRKVIPDRAVARRPEDRVRDRVHERVAVGMTLEPHAVRNDHAPEPELSGESERVRIEPQPHASRHVRLRARIASASSRSSGVVIFRVNRETGTMATGSPSLSQSAASSVASWPDASAFLQDAGAKRLGRRGAEEIRAVHRLEDPPVRDALDRVHDRRGGDRRAGLFRRAKNRPDLAGRDEGPRRVVDRDDVPVAELEGLAAEPHRRGPRRPSPDDLRARALQPLEVGDPVGRRDHHGPREVRRRERIERPGKQRFAGEGNERFRLRAPEPASRAGGDDDEQVRHLDREDLLLLGLQEVVDLLDFLVRQLLRFLQAAALVVLGDGLVLVELLDPIVALVAVAADLDARLLGHRMRLLRQVLAPILGQRRDRNPDDLAVGLRVQAELRLADRALDLHGHLRVPRRRHDQGRVRNREVGDLVDRDVGPVGRDEDAVEHSQVGAPRAQRLEAILQGGDRVGHLRLDVLQLLPHGLMLPPP